MMLSFLSLAENITEELGTSDVPPIEVVKIINGTFSKIEKDFTLLAECGYRDNKPSMSIVSSGCLVSLIWGQKVFTANVGDSRAVICYDRPDGPGWCGKEMARDNSCCEQSYIRQPSHPKTRCIGNAHLKMAHFTTEESFEAPEEDRVENNFTESVLSAIPKVSVRDIKETDRFIIFGSGGLWKLLTNEQAAKFVNSRPRGGIARKLATYAVKLAAEKSGLTYSKMMLVPEGTDMSGRSCVSSEPVRPIYHDDITVAVVYLDINKNIDSKTFYSYHSHSYNVLPSGFKDDLDIVKKKKDDPDNQPKNRKKVSKVYSIWDD
ncbi:putative protein phosphatase 2C 43-like [Trifolium medium]|uniref:PPM-type phosphatase domain-containing protein n=1 Tax=Trifolium medium TaxID=97028 RepID=A0A392MGN6_9FABA|nr:putative protein phosphatase 2C 43-like [Trifolium medium]